MKLGAVACLMALLVLSAPMIPAEAGQVATQEQLDFLRKDILEGRIIVGKTRLSEFRDLYGEAQDITTSENKVIYNYGDLKVEFDVDRYWREWRYDYTHKQAYSNDINDLRYDLEDQQIVGEYVSFSQMRRDYDEPTEAFETDEDGNFSVYYWGELKLTFENVIVVRGWRGRNLDEARGRAEQPMQSVPAKK